MKEMFREPKKLREATRILLASILSVVDDYQAQGYKLTLRQLYYQLVSRDILPNQQKQYAKLSTILVDARMCGQVDWSVIEDRVRIPNIPAAWDNIRQIVDIAADQYRKHRHEGQDNYVEVWCEKDALSAVLERVTKEYHVPLMVNRGYSSVSAMYEAAKRFKYASGDSTILYFGDHDPSGLDMIRDVADRLAEFRVFVDVVPVALTMEQIEEYDPPPNPAKVTDPRAEAYIEEHGDVSWELDALQPQVLHSLLRTHLNELIDMDKYNAIVAVEEEDKEKLRELLDHLD